MATKITATNARILAEVLAVEMVIYSEGLKNVMKALPTPIELVVHVVRTVGFHIVEMAHKMREKSVMMDQLTHVPVSFYPLVNVEQTVLFQAVEMVY